jgi:hypothetical protein
MWFRRPDRDADRHPALTPGHGSIRGLGDFALHLYRQMLKLLLRRGQGGKKEVVSADTTNAGRFARCKSRSGKAGLGFQCRRR